MNIKNYNNFDEMELKENLLRGIYSYGFEKPSLIQQQAIVPIIKGDDIIAQAQSGTGKTGTFSISILEKIDNRLNYCQAIIISPIRELAVQTYNVIKNLGLYLNININLCIGGTDLIKNFKEFKDTVHIVVGTPGRIYDLINKRILKIDHLKILVIDEADEMLSYGFQEQIKEIINKIPISTQICLFSATISNDILDISKKFMKDTKHILVKNDELTLEGIKQFYIAVGEDKYKLMILKDLYKTLKLGQTIIYVNTIRRIEHLSQQLEEDNYPVVYIHGNMEQAERNIIMKQFRMGSSRILITTDLLARGIDIQQISLVINYDMPSIRKKENYIHRIGRSGRFGRKGIAINFVTNNDYRIKEELEKFYNTQIQEMPENIDQYFN
jgi:translation initiation factor 4A